MLLAGLDRGVERRLRGVEPRALARDPGFELLALAGDVGEGALELSELALDTVEADELLEVGVHAGGAAEDRISLAF